jgi:hypothetical protein
MKRKAKTGTPNGGLIRRAPAKTYFLNERHELPPVPKRAPKTMFSVYNGKKFIARVTATSDRAAIAKVSEHEKIAAAKLTAKVTPDKDKIKPAKRAPDCKGPLGEVLEAARPFTLGDELCDGCDTNRHPSTKDTQKTINLFVSRAQMKRLTDSLERLKAFRAAFLEG